MPIHNLKLRQIILLRPDICIWIEEATSHCLTIFKIKKEETKKPLTTNTLNEYVLLLVCQCVQCTYMNVNKLLTHFIRARMYCVLFALVVRNVV